MILSKIKILFALVLITVIITSCYKDPNNPGTEYAPQMYVSKAYEPFSQVEKNKLNPMGLNVRTPAKGTIARRRFNTLFEDGDTTVRDIMVYNIHKDSIGIAERILKPPFAPSEKVLEEGKVLFVRYCSPCHGEQGDGQGKVAGMYKGVANISSSGALKNVNSGHIYHVITHGKGRMWPHGSQLNSDERWKVVYYVHTLQGQDLSANGKKAEEGKTEAKKDSTSKK